MVGPCARSMIIACPQTRKHPWHRIAVPSCVGQCCRFSGYVDTAMHPAQYAIIIDGVHIGRPARADEGPRGHKCHSNGPGGRPR